jgi:hypothetical protein
MIFFNRKVRKAFLRLRFIGKEHKVRKVQHFLFFFAPFAQTFENFAVIGFDFVNNRNTMRRISLLLG